MRRATSVTVPRCVVRRVKRPVESAVDPSSDSMRKTSAPAIGIPSALRTVPCISVALSGDCAAVGDASVASTSSKASEAARRVMLERTGAEAARLQLFGEPAWRLGERFVPISLKGPRTFSASIAGGNGNPQKQEREANRGFPLFVSQVLDHVAGNTITIVKESETDNSGDSG